MVITTSTNAVSYSWSPSNSLSCDTCALTSAKPTATTTYTVVMTTGNGCRVIDTVTIVVEGCGNFWIPNAFTPNGDRVNEVFAPIGKCMVSYEMYIFDRWGQIIYHTDASKPWNGTVNGGTVVVQEDTYVYQFNIMDSDKQMHTLIGRVSVIK
jgi:gliding motility-associated-like protein